MDDVEKFWTDLLAYIKAGRVIPVVGERTVTFGKKNQYLYPFLASKLRKRLKLDRRQFKTAPDFTDVTCEWLVSGGNSVELYKELCLAYQELADTKPLPGTALRALASIPKFNLFLTTTFDSLLAEALRLARPGGAAPAIRGFFPNKDASEKDLPARKARLPGPTVYHLFGEASVIEGEYVVWEEDILEFMCGLHATLSSGKDLDLLSRDLTDNALLVIGLNFTDLLVRLFLRIAKQNRLTSLGQREIIAEHTPGFAKRGNVLFFGGVLKNVHIHEQDPIDFAIELAARWHEANPAPVAAKAQSPSPMPAGSIFISYAREDEPQARELAAGLQKHGCAVYYDRERLHAGDFWPEKLQQAVSRDCSAFISLVSETTESAESGYWRTEREWAAKRLIEFYPKEFYVPVCLPPAGYPFQSEPQEVAQRISAIPLPQHGTAEFTRFAERLRALQIRRAPVPV